MQFRMTIHREGYSTLVLTIILGLAINIPIWLLLGVCWTSILVSGFYFISFLFILRFFRYPDRITEAKPNSIISPADGKIISISEENETEYFQENRIRVSVFMSGFNVHANWIPTVGTVQYSKYHPGRNLLAIHPKSSDLNERTSVVIIHENGLEILVRQIAGIFARRVVTYPKSGQIVKQGEELGFIKFGSRLDIFLPVGTDIKVELKQLVKGTKTILAEL